VPHGPETIRVARSIAEKGEFANPFAALDTGPSAHVAPAFPALLALLIRLFGDGTTGMYAIQLAAAIVLSLQLALFPVFSRALGMGELNGIIAASIWIAARAGWTWGLEAEYAAILLAIAVCCFRSYLDSSSSGSSRLVWLLGCVIGVLLLTSPSVSIILVGFVGLLLWKDKLAIWKRSNLLLIILLPAVIVAPWTIRNFLVFHRLIPIRDDFGLELALSNSDCAQYQMVKNFNPCYRHPDADIEEAKKVLTHGEAGYNELKLREALYWIEGHPFIFFKLCVERFVAFWKPPAANGPWWSVLGPNTYWERERFEGRLLERIAILAMTVLSVPGLFMLFRRDSVSAWLCLMCLGLYPLAYYLIQFTIRYRYPILWVTFLLGSLPITAFVRATCNSVYAKLRKHRTVAISD
ncbi:MAG: hypothetical protein JO333_20550, partial [Verrucomicrobia bacterium]|nr:hypothetical protein [Verrucomicrobiota bacterium]